MLGRGLGGVRRRAGQGSGFLSEVPSNTGLGWPRPVECVGERFERLSGQRSGDACKTGRKPVGGPVRPSRRHRGMQLVHPPSQAWRFARTPLCARLSWLLRFGTPVRKRASAGRKALARPPAHAWPVRRERLLSAIGARRGSGIGTGSRRSATGSTFASNRPRRFSLGFLPSELDSRSLPRHANRIRGLLRWDCLRGMLEIVPLGSLARFSGAAMRLAGRTAAPDLGIRPAWRSPAGPPAAGGSAIASPANVAFQAFPMHGTSTGFRRRGSAWRARAESRGKAHSRLGRPCRDWPTLGRRARPCGSDHSGARPAWTATPWKKR